MIIAFCFSKNLLSLAKCLYMLFIQKSQKVTKLKLN